MKLLIVRHGDPDYSIDSLTEKGWREAEYLSERLEKVPARAYYVSPLGRAKDTASLTLKKVNRTATVCDWLREFPPTIKRPDGGGADTIVWDWLPLDWMPNEQFYRRDEWLENDIIKAGHVPEAYAYVTSSLDALLEEHGYKREGSFYRALAPHNDTIIFFCHFGLECVLLSHLLNISPMQLWHGTAAAPTSVTTVVTEERRPGIASFRMSAFGDISHLYIHGEEPSFSARFRECYTNEDERLD